MKKSLYIFIGMLAAFNLCNAQDTISLKKGEIILAKVLEVRQTEVKYKLVSDLNGPTYLLDISDISNIAYENGTKISFKSDITKAVNTPEISAETSPEPIIQTPNQPIKKPINIKAEKKFIAGFNLGTQTGTWPATALTNMGSSSYLKNQGHSIISYGLGVIFQYKIHKNFSLFLDGNIYNFNIKIGEQGETVQSPWTLAEGAAHMNEPDAPNTTKVNNLPTDVHYDMMATGFRLGGKYYFSQKSIRPWLGAGFGFYRWDVNYFNKEKDKTYGKDGGYVTGLTYLAGVDIVLAPGLIISPFIDATSPVVDYNINGLFYPQWNINWTKTPIMGSYRFGLSLYF